MNGEYIKLVKESIDLGKEYIIWGIPSKKNTEEPLYTKSKNMVDAKQVEKILKSNYGVTKTRIQVLDLTTKPDFKDIVK